MKLALVTLVACANALIPITIKGNRFIKPAVKASDDGEVFFLKGVDYQPGGLSAYTGNDSDGDVLLDADTCFRDAYVLQQAGVNVIRTYTVNPNVNHDECMSILNAAGIYVILDVNLALDGQSLNRNLPASLYNKNYLTRVFQVIEAFKDYPNLLGFFSGNEVVNDEKSAAVSPPYLRAIQRDMKQYIAKHANRSIPVGYSAADELSLRKVTFDYLTCDNGDDLRADFFGLNSYEWCSGSLFSSSGYLQLNSTFSNSSVPLFFSEYGCNKETPRSFDEISKGIYSGLEYTFSGGLVYEYAEEENEYGLIKVDGDTLSYKKDFDNFKSQLEKVNLSTIISSSDVANRSFAKCLSSLVSSDDLNFNLTFTIPAQPSDIADLIKNGISDANQGKIVDVTAKSSKFTIKDSNGDTVLDATVSFSGENEINSQDGTTPAVSSATKSASLLSSASSTATSSSKSSKGEAAAYGTGVSLTGLLAVAAGLLL